MSYIFDILSISNILKGTMKTYHLDYSMLDLAVTPHVC